MAGGAVKQGRVDNAILGRYLGFFKPFFDLFMRFRRDWISIVNYMQRASAPKNGEITTEVDAPYYVKGERGSIAANEQATVSMLSVVEADGRIREKNPGVYGGPDAGLSANYTLSWMSGTGTLFVRRSALNGTMFILR